ncbi:unnamed protein product [Rhodiola kirilowii]
MNTALLSDISEEEIKRAIFSLGSLKAPGIDGFPAIFYQKFWERCKASTISEVNLFWSEGVLDEELNRTLITLIPKKKDAERMEDWRPISLFTVAIKIITKILAMRLRSILNQIFSPFQSAFIKGRIISDNFIVAHEIAHYLKNCGEHSSYYASIKVDMSKAYDRVEWLFLEKLLLKLGFADKWFNRIIKCVSSISYQVRVNDNISSVIKPGRGLRQGDPLSPYLFLFCTELLNAKLRCGVDRNLISGVRICRKAPIVTHLLFADDSIFFIKAGVSEASSLKHILNQYEKVSGQRINFEKLEVSFSMNTPADVRNKLLSAAGKEVLVKAVIQAMPVYMMNVYQFPKNIIAKIVKLIQQFLQGEEGRKGISWLSLATLQRKKCDGGLGFKDLGAFNEAILLKVAWRMVTSPHLLVSKVLLAKYCGGGSILAQE